MNWPYLRRAQLDRRLEWPTYWLVHGEPFKATHASDERFARLNIGRRIECWEWEAVVIADELGVERPRFFGLKR